MTLDSSLLKQLIETFHVELESLLSIIIDNLQQIKSSDPANDRSVMMEEISRAGRNIKVSALSVGVDHLGTIAEYIEKLFLPTTNTLSEDLINLTFQAVNGMREVMHDFIEKTPHSATVHELIHQLQQQVYETEKEEEPGALIVEKKQDVAEVVPSLHGLDDDFLKKIMETFAIELQENLIIITNGLLQLENGGRSEQEFLHLFAEIFRAAHNIKGSARGVGAMAVGDIAHHIETLFTVIQQKNIKISPVIINLCLQSIDYMSEAMRCYSDHIPISFDLPHHLMQLEHYTQLPLEEMQPTIGKSFSFNETFKIPEIAIKANEFESIRVSLQNLDRVSVYMEEIQAIKIAIEEHYSDLNKINCKIDYFVQATKKRLFKLKDLLGDENEGFDSLSAIHLSELTEISNVAHKIQRELRMPVNELSILLNSLQDEVGTMRLIPISRQLRYLPRVVRDLAIELGKQVIFEIKSNEVTIDKMIMDGLKDPIVHILRNAIDHGIESSAVREAKGKPPQGSIVINVSQEDHQIVFEISDDGAGIRADDVSRIALSKNIITQAELAGMKPEDVIDLIFRPGFSTREIATDISGRGVGLDVVRSNLMHL
jgi:two-component system chemotaxis sensor kinase CheA